MVIPSDSWLESLDASFEAGISAQGITPYYIEIEHKPVARFLIRLSEITELDEIWLSFSRVEEGDQDTLPSVEFEASGKLKKAIEKEKKEEQEKGTAKQ